jgi:hypothetical protein
MHTVTCTLRNLRLLPCSKCCDGAAQITMLSRSFHRPKFLERQAPPLYLLGFTHVHLKLVVVVLEGGGKLEQS